jgi:hypothetical protein
LSSVIKVGILDMYKELVRIAVELVLDLSEMKRYGK